MLWCVDAMPRIMFSSTTKIRKRRFIYLYDVLYQHTPSHAHRASIKLQCPFADKLQFDTSFSSFAYACVCILYLYACALFTISVRWCTSFVIDSPAYFRSWWFFLSLSLRCFFFHAFFYSSIISPLDAVVFVKVKLSAHQTKHITNKIV